MAQDTCALCGEYDSLPDSEVCSMCATDSRLLGSDAEWLAPEAHAEARSEVPDWAARHREAQRSGEVFEGERHDRHMKRMRECLLR